MVAALKSDATLMAVFLFYLKATLIRFPSCNIMPQAKQVKLK